MKHLDYILKGFGFENSQDFLKSTFGFIYTSHKIMSLDLIIASIFAAVQFLFGFNHLFLIAYTVLLIFEWITGVSAASRKNIPHKSRKFGRMLLKIAVYLVPIYILNAFEKNANFPKIFGYEIDPFDWLYWVYLIAVIWQLFISMLENLDVLGFRFAKVLIRIINARFYKQFELEDEINGIT